MSWFDEQIKSREEHDDDVFNKSFVGMVNSVLGERYSFHKSQVKGAIGDILTYYNMPNIKIPENITEDEKILDYLSRTCGIMQRTVKLEKGWHKDAFGPMLAVLKESGKMCALLPKGARQYTFFNEETKRNIVVNASNEDLFELDALCFYKPLPSKPITTKELLKFAFSVISAADIIVIIVVAALCTALGLFIPVINNLLFSKIVESKDATILLSTIIFFICISVSTVLFKVVKQFVNSRMLNKMTLLVDSATMMRVLSLPSGFFREYSTGEITQRMTYVSSICQTIVNTIFTTGLSCIFAFAYIPQIFAYAPALGLPSILVILANIIFSIISVLYQTKITKKQLEITAINNGIAFSMITGIQKIKLAGAEKRSFARWANSFSKQTQLTYNPPLFLKLNGTISVLISLIGQFIMFYLALKSGVGVANYYSFTTAYGMVSGAFMGLSTIALTAANIRPAVEMSKPILDALPESSEEGKALSNLSGDIELSRVTFKYSDDMPNVLEDFSLKIERGQYIAIVGKTGCGKSTLVRLLLGFEKPSTGEIYYDGTPFSSLDIKSVRKQIGSVMQDGQLLQGDIYNNIVICDPNLPIERAWEAAEISGIADDIRNMPMGMHTVVSEGSGGISGGQKQRLMIARAIAPKPKILIFDEATSALDNITQKKISEALDELKCTRIVIAHRLSTIKHCDRIIYMEDGKITEDGTYEELMEKKGQFYNLVERQKIN